MEAKNTIDGGTSVELKSTMSAAGGTKAFGSLDMGEEVQQKNLHPGG